jgi:hypothetical protein
VKKAVTGGDRVEERGMTRRRGEEETYSLDILHNSLPICIFPR